MCIMSSKKESINAHVPNSIGASGGVNLSKEVRCHIVITIISDAVAEQTLSIISATVKLLQNAVESDT